YIFFFQAEDGIRDRNVTGVQTCALPILPAALRSDAAIFSAFRRRESSVSDSICRTGIFTSSLSGCRYSRKTASSAAAVNLSIRRSEERRVGKEVRSAK